MQENKTLHASGTIDGEGLHTIRRLRDLRVIVETELEDQSDQLLSELRRLQVNPRLINRKSHTLPSDGEVIFCDYAPDLARRLPWPPGEATAALIVMVPTHGAFSSSALEAATPNAVLARPFTANAVEANLIIGFSQFRYERRMRSKAEKLEETISAMRMIERAKSIVMNTRSVNGEDAYQYIRSQAMARRQSVSGIAEAIVSSFDLLGALPLS
jgi:AmiR/NasT family two-component response regulator